MDVINVTYYDLLNSFFKPGKSDRERVTVYTCTNCENCQAYKNKTCIMLNGLWGHRCQYGRKNVTEGYTRAARKCGQLIRDTRDMYKDQCYALKEVKHIEQCGDYIFLNLPWLDCNDKYRSQISDENYEYTKTIGPEIKEKVEFGDMVKVEDFTPEFIRKLIDFRPQAIFGGTITKYYEEQIPQFCYDLRKYFKELYEATLKLKPEIEELANKITHVGKKAKLKTLNPGEVKVGSNYAMWDGEKLVANSNVLTIISSDFDDAQVIIIPTDNTVVTIFDDNTVTDSTEFV